MRSDILKKILVIGSINIDLVTNVEKTPRVGETVLGNEFLEFPGGKGANQAAAIGRLGGNVTMLGKVGADAYGKFMKSAMEDSGVKTDYVVADETKTTGTALIMVNADGDNSIVVIPGANFSVLPEDITEELISEFDIVIGQLEVPVETLEKAFKIARSMDKMTILNPAPAKALSKAFLSTVSLLVPNETELEILTGVTVKDDLSINESYLKLKETGIKQLIVTLGSKGSVLVDSNGLRRFAAQSVKAIDTTAAGDSFIGGLATQLAMGESLETSIEYATKVAAIAITRMGAQSSLPYKEELE